MKKLMEIGVKLFTLITTTVIDGETLVSTRDRTTVSAA